MSFKLIYFFVIFYLLSNIIICLINQLKEAEWVSLSWFENLLYKTSNIFSPKVFGIFNFGHFFCPFFKNPEKSWRKIKFVTIILI